MKPKMIEDLLIHNLVYHGCKAEKPYWSIVFYGNDWVHTFFASYQHSILSVNCHLSSLLELIMNFLRSEVRLFKDG